MNCPHCGANVSDIASLDINCKYCHKRIYVRVIPESGMKVLFTMEQAEEFDKERENEYSKKGKKQDQFDHKTG